MYGVIQLWQMIIAVNAWKRCYQQMVQQQLIDVQQQELKNCYYRKLAKGKKIWLERNKAINKELKWTFQDGTWKFGQTFFFFYTSCRFSTHFSPNKAYFSALQPESCPKSKAASTEPEGWCLLICGPSDLYRGVKPSVFEFLQSLKSETFPFCLSNVFFTVSVVF